MAVAAAAARRCCPPQAATALYRKAVEWMEDSEKDALAVDVFRQAVAHLVRQQQWAEAVGMLLRFAASCDACGARNSLCKSYLGAVVVWLYAGDANSAWLTYQVRQLCRWLLLMAQTPLCMAARPQPPPGCS